MGKLLYVAAALCLLIALADFVGRAYTEAQTLLFLALVLGVAGTVVSRNSTRPCPKCVERVHKHAVKCKHCGADLHAEKNPRPANLQK